MYTTPTLDQPITVDLSGLRAHRRTKPEPAPEVSEAVDGTVAGVGNVTVSGEAWSEKHVAPGEVEIRIASGVPWTEDERVLSATYGSDPEHHYPSIEAVRQLLRAAVALAVDEVAWKEEAEREARRWAFEQAVLDAVEAQPGINTSDLQKAVREALGVGRDQDVRRARTALFDRDVISCVDGAKRSTLHYLGRAEAVAEARLGLDGQPVTVSREALRASRYGLALDEEMGVIL